jgi:magnesium transporter
MAEENKAIIISKQLFHENREEEFKSSFLDLHPYDQAEIFIELTPEERQKLYKILSSEEVSELFAYMIEDEDLVTIFDNMEDDYASELLSEMASDDAADIIQKLDKSDASNYLEMMDDEDQADIMELLHYEEDTAGSIMTNDFIEININDNIKQAMRKMINMANEAETIYSLYVTDDEGILVGVLSLKELITAKGDEKIIDIMTDDVIKVDVMEDQEDVAKTIQDYDFLAIPVVDKGNHMLGIITVDDLIDVVLEEAAEDYSKFAALGDSEFDVDTETVTKSVRKRLPWLIVLLLVGTITASISEFFVGTTSKLPILINYMPLILGMAGNTGTQALAVTLRGLTTEEFEERKDVFIHLFREVRIGLMNGFLMGATTFVYAYFIMGQPLLIGVLLGAVIVIALMIATFAGAVIPLLIELTGLDPAVASGPFITTINDVIAVSIYLGLATIFLDKLI